MPSRRRPLVLTGAILLVGTAVAGYLISRARPAPVADTTRPVISEAADSKAPLVLSVHAFYPGANAQTVAETVATPIEQQVNGVEHMVSMSSQSANNGGYTLHVSFEAGTDLDVAQVLVQNRISLALPVIPALVQREGVSVRTTSPEPLVLVSLTSPDGRFDSLYLSNYSTINVKDELARVPGVGDVVLFGQRGYRIRIALDAAQLAAHQLSATDVVTAIRQQNVQVAGGPADRGTGPNAPHLQLTITALGRRIEPEQLEGVIVKATPDGRTVRLKDVARVELDVDERSDASINGKPAVVLGIHPLPNANPSAVRRAVLDTLATLRANAPDGLALEVAFDFAPNPEDLNNPATPEHLVIDAELPEGVSAERTAHTLARAAELMRNTPGVQDVLTLTEHPFSPVRDRPCLVVRLTPTGQRRFGRERIAGGARVALRTQLPEAVFRLSVPSAAAGFPIYGFPIECAIEDRGDHGSEILRDRAGALVDKMSQSGKYADVGVGPGLRRVPVLSLNIDRTRCLAHGVEIDEVLKAVQANLGPVPVGTFNPFGRTRQINVPLDPRVRARASDVLKLQVRNKQDQPVPFGAVMDVRDSVGPAVIERHNLYPVAWITANLAEGVPLAEAKSVCEALAEQELGSRPFKLIWRTR